MPLAPFMPEVCLGIMPPVTPVSKAPFLIDKADARRFSKDATGLRRQVIHRNLPLLSLDLPCGTSFFIFFAPGGVRLCALL